MSTTTKNSPQDSASRGDSNKIPVLVLFGPTGSGKTRMLRELLPGRGELINSDSIQIYQHLNIGSAKPSKNELELFPHHLVDELDPKQPFTAGTFCRLAETLVQDIHQRGMLPVISGGTGFYFKTLLCGGAPTPEVDPIIRQQVQEDQDSKGLPWLFHELEGFDPVYAAKVGPQDALRIRRATEVYRQTHRALSDFDLSTELREDWDIGLFGLQWERDQLYARIEERVDRMLAEGLQEEVQGLIEKGYSWEDPGLKGIGYQEWAPFFAGERDLAEVVRLIKRNSRRYAKRQITFFKGIPGVQWLPGVDPLESFYALYPRLSS